MLGSVLLICVCACVCVRERERTMKLLIHQYTFVVRMNVVSEEIIFLLSWVGVKIIVSYSVEYKV